jgi:hypothetical protein
MIRAGRKMNILDLRGYSIFRSEGLRPVKHQQSPSGTQRPKRIS